MSVPAAEVLLEEARARHRAGALDDAERGYREVLAHDPRHADALHGLAALACQWGQLEPGIELARQVLAVAPQHARAHHLIGLAFDRLGRRNEALASLDAAVAADPAFADAHACRGDVLAVLGRGFEAVEAYDRALALRPGSPDDWCNRGVVLHDLDRDLEAVASFDRALALDGNFIEAHYNRGNALAHLRRYDDALKAFQRTLAGRPDYVDALNNCGHVLHKLGRSEDALAQFARALEVRPGFAEARVNQGDVLFGLGRVAEAAAAYEQVLAIAPDHRYMLGNAAHCRRLLCDWRGQAARDTQVRDAVARRRPAVQPLTLLAIGADPALQRACAEIYVGDKIAGDAKPASMLPATARGDMPNRRLRIAYLSTDFRTHPVGSLMADLIEQHDRARFEIFGVSYAANDGSAIRARLVAAFDHFHDASAEPDSDVDAFLRAQRIDIAVDLNGHTQGARLGALASRPAPVQVSYLGFPGTVGAGFIDYVLADPVILPFDRQAFYSEQIVHLPDCYMPAVPRNLEVAPLPGRAAAGLPEQGLVLCAFNQSFKIAPALFDIWMRLLADTPGSVLWLTRPHALAMENLRREATARGVDPGRLIFAPRVDAMADHQARLSLADLFLDTLPYNAHSTAHDALAAGVPIITCRGPSFEGRVAASLVTAAGLPELVTDSLEAYEGLARDLAHDPTRRQALRDKLRANRSTAPLFDPDRFRRGIEAAYARMWETACRGEPPQGFAVKLD
jgi:predicted O-linked N-acetylglucosamine transferase (SPINDLY family)